MENSGHLFETIKGKILELLPDLIISLLVLIGAYLIARLFKYLVEKLFGHLGRLARRRFQDIDFKQAGTFLGTAIFWLIMFSSILVITDILELSVLTQWFQGIMHYIPNILAAILIVFASLFLGNLVSDALLSLGKRTGVKYSGTLLKVIRFTLLLLAVIIALDQIGIEIALLIDIIDIVLAALLFGAALAFGLGAKTSISNILACYYIRKRYKVGDEIKVGKVSGIIIKIDATNIILDNEMGQITIPAKTFNETTSYLLKKD